MQLDQFQELPQLLDRHLSYFVQTLSSAFLEYLEHHGDRYHLPPNVAPSQHLTPLPRAVCKILYTLCKVRGHKVVAQLLGNEAKHLEPMLRAFCRWSQLPETPDQPKPFDPAEMTWEERYVMLLWLSHLMLIPFDLTSVASDEVADGLSSPTIPFAVPAETPRIARHLLSRALCYLSVPGKEREAARALLVRLALRTDMLRLGLHGTIISWSLGVVEHGGGDPPPAQHESIGALSFLVGFVKSADDGIMRQLLAPIWECMQSTFEQPSLRIDAILSSAVVRKSTIKIYCLLGVVAKRLLLDGSQAMLGDVAARLVDGLDDKETPVRLAASKASSMISSHVGEEMTSYIVDALLEGLEQDFRYSSTEHGERRPIADSRFVPASDVQPDYTSVDALGWHGYILTMAHLLFRRAIPAARLVDITGWLYLALDFDQRSTLGASIGTNVRDAACFGLWSLSRKYTSGEILGRARDASGESAASSLQKTAGKLVEAACLDPSGNIRRGSSAALQELVGRHPDQVAAGLALVQCVDYHAVASVQGAMLVGIEAARSDVVYEHVLFHGLLGWRGLRSTDAATRRLSAETIGRLVTTTRSLSFNDAIGTLEDRLGQTRVTDVEHRHGIITALARIVQSLHGTNHAEDTSPADEFGCLRTDESATPIPVTTPRPDAMRNWALVLGLHRGSTLTKHDRDAAERSQYTHEARSHFIWALASAIRCKHAIPDARPVASAFDPLMSDETLVRMSLARQESLVVMYTSRAMVGFLALMPVVERRQLLRAMITMVRSSEPRFQGLRKVGSIRAVGLATVVFRDLAAEHGRITADVHSIIDSLLEQTSAGNEIEVRCAALESLVRGPFFYCQGTLAANLTVPRLTPEQRSHRKSCRPCKSASTTTPSTTEATWARWSASRPSTPQLLHCVEVSCDRTPRESASWQESLPSRRKSWTRSGTMPRDACRPAGPLWTYRLIHQCRPSPSLRGTAS